MIARLLAVASVAALAGTPLRADDDAKRAAAVAGAIVLLGTAAILHHEGHYEDDRSYNDSEKVAAFERGYRDGLHNAPYNAKHHSGAYGDGYAAGQNERSHRLSYRDPEGDGPEAPTLALQACVGEAAGRWKLSSGHVHVTKARQSGADQFLVEVAAGKHRGYCAVAGDGKLFQFHKGAI